MSTLFMNVADMLIAGERSQYARLVKDYMDNGMTKEQAMSAAAFDVFAKQPILEGAKGGAIAAVMSIPGTAGAIRAGEILGRRAAVADEQGTFKTVRAMEAGPAAQAQAVKTNIANGLATLEQANARLAKQGGIANKTAFKTDAANNTLMDYLTGKGSAQLAADAFRKIANEAIASGKLTAQEAATLKGALRQAKVYVDAMALMGDNGGAKQINPGTLNNVEARKWYLENEARIPELIDRSLPLEQQAKQAFNLRNQFRRQARELMADRELAESLNKSDPNLSWEQIVQKQIDKGYKGDDIFRAIIESAQRSRKSVNMQLGLE